MSTQAPTRVRPEARDRSISSSFAAMGAWLLLVLEDVGGLSRLSFATVMQVLTF